MNPGPGHDWLAADRRHAWHPYTQHGLDPDPLPVIGARGAWLTLRDGHRMLDAISSWWCCLHGHGRSELIQALLQQARTLDHVLFAGCTHEPAARLAERLTALAPGQLTRCFFSDDGSTAVEVALKAAIAWHRRRAEPQRTRILALEGGYHGDTFGAMALGDPVPFFEDTRELLFEVDRVALQEDVLLDRASALGPHLAAVVLEPHVQGAAGMRAVSPALVRAARKACDETGALLIADEVMTGFGRTGRLFALEHSGVAADLLCLSKALTGGMLPLAATLCTEEIYAAFHSRERGRMFFHGHTFTANPIACAVALASLELVAQEGTPQRMEQIGQWIEAPLRRDLRPAHGSLRRFGGIVAIDVTLAGDGYADPASERLRQRARTLSPDVLLRPLGPVLYAMPPACTTQPECEQIARRMLGIVTAGD